MDTTMEEDHKMSLFQCTFSNFENGSLTNKIIVIKNSGEAKKIIEERYEGEKKQQGRSSQVGGPQYNKFESNSKSCTRLP
jgi:hypothetical protein